MYPPPPTYAQRNNNYFNNNNQRGGYGGGRGGRGGYQCNNNNQHVPTGPPTTQLSVPNPYKRFENMNYCHMHGGDVDDFHTSATCSKPGQFHVYDATCDNTMGGSVSGLHKTIMPSASGRRPAGRTPYQPYNYPNRAPMLPTMQQQQMRPPTNPVYNNMPAQMPPTPYPAAQNMVPPMATMQQCAMAMMTPSMPMPAYNNMQPTMAAMPAPMQQQQFYRYNY